MKPLRLQHSFLCTNEASFNHRFTGENVTSSTFRKRGTSPHTTIALDVGEHPRVLTPHPPPAPDVLGDSQEVKVCVWVRIQHCTFGERHTGSVKTQDLFTSARFLHHLAAHFHRHRRRTDTSSSPIASPPPATSPPCSHHAVQEEGA